eukprot:851012-Prorocentrum_minimum.AAC.1
MSVQSPKVRPPPGMVTVDHSPNPEPPAEGCESAAEGCELAANGCESAAEGCESAAEGCESAAEGCESAAEGCELRRWSSSGEAVTVAAHRCARPHPRTRVCGRAATSHGGDWQPMPSARRRYIPSVANRRSHTKPTDVAIPYNFAICLPYLYRRYRILPYFFRTCVSQWPCFPPCRPTLVGSLLQGGGKWGAEGGTGGGGSRNSPAERREVIGFVTSSQHAGAWKGKCATGFCEVEALARLWSRQVGLQPLSPS